MAGFNPVETDEEGMADAGKEFGRRVDSFNIQLKGINGEMGTLQSTWTGSTSTSFNNAMDSWERAFVNVIDELIKMMDTMGINTKGYSDTEDTNQASANTFAAALPGV